jgi:hypothetical protein
MKSSTTKGRRSWDGWNLMLFTEPWCPTYLTKFRCQRYKTENHLSTTADLDSGLFDGSGYKHVPVGSRSGYESNWILRTIQIIKSENF